CGRVPLRRLAPAARARPRGGDRDGLAARRPPGRPGGGQPFDRWIRRAVRSGAAARRGRLLRRGPCRRPRAGARLVQRVLLADRWANEGFASAYAAQAMTTLGLP